MTQHKDSNDFDIVPTGLAVEALRDSGYRNTAYALSELIDNSVQAGASMVEAFCIEETRLGKTRNKRVLTCIAVMDNGTGMDAGTLRVALQFGNGTRLRDRSGMGRFGMGLPSSSISQCRHVDVWTWQSGPDNAIYSYLDISEIRASGMREVPDPVLRPLPEEWRIRSKGLGAKGTLVVWRDLDRLTWRGAKSTLEHTENEIGRIYRYFLHGGSVQICLVAIQDGEKCIDRYACPNDPLYLMVPSSTPEPYDTKPMFERFGGEDWERKIEVEIADGTVHEVVIRASCSLPEVRREPIEKNNIQAGSLPYGKHAAKNLGLSILRAGRELALDIGWIINHDPVERWWGMEIEFPASLDEIFGVTNNKQEARHFSEFAKFDWKNEAEEGESEGEFKKRLEEEGDPRWLLFKIVSYIEKTLQDIRQQLKDQTKGMRQRGHEKKTRDTSVEQTATRAVEHRIKQGHTGSSDRFPPIPGPKIKQVLADDLVKDKHYNPSDATEIVKAVVENKNRFVFAEASMPEVPSFFTVEFKAQIIIITLNRVHPFYEHLIKMLHTGEEDGSILPMELMRAHNVLWLILCAWARCEDEVGEESRKQIRNIRATWGRMVSDFFQEDNFFLQ